MAKPKKKPRSRASRQPVPGWATGLRAQGATQAGHTAGRSSREPQLEPDTSRPTASFDDPILRYHAYRIDHVGISAFLVALAAWQRGLKVSFHYEVASKCQRFANAPIQGFRGEFFSVSDGHKTHFFRRTLGDLTSREVSRLCEDKQATKQRLIEHGIDVPDGIVVSRDDTSGLDAFLARHPGKRFILEPLSGTLGNGLVRDVAADDVISHIHASQIDSPLLLEETVKGNEYRVYVTDRRYIAAFERCPVSVQGDGVQSIAQLVAARQHQRRQGHPQKAIAIPLGENERIFLGRQGLTFESVLPAGKRVYLNDDPSLYHGADQMEVTASLPDAVRAACVRCAQAMKLPNTGVDVIVAPDTGRYVILEANQCPILIGAAFPTLSASTNHVAESIVDRYFPESMDKPRHLQASFDFMQVCQTLQSGMVGEVALPVIGPDWQHQRFSIPATRMSDDTETNVRRAMFTYGIHAQLIRSGVGDLIVDVVAPELHYRAFQNALAGTIPS